MPLGVGQLLTALRSLDRLLTLETKHGAAIERLAGEIDKLKDRVTRLETREEVVITEAKAAAGVAASGVAMHSVADLARRIGTLEERSAQQRLGPPAPG